MSALDIGTVLAVFGLFYKLSETRAIHAEEMGKIKQQVRSLESRAALIDTKLGDVDQKLSQLMESNARLEAHLNLLLGRRGHKLIDTPAPFKTMISSSLEGRD
jgi:regulator of replication initiation timing